MGPQTPVRLRNAASSPASIPSRPPRHRLCLGARGACRGRSSTAQPVEDNRQFLPFSIWPAGINATSHVTLSDGHPVFITQSKHSKIGMRWRRIAQKSLLDVMGIWIDSRLISCQPFLSQILPAASAVAYRRSEDCGTLVEGKVAWPRDARVIRPKPLITLKNSCSAHKYLVSFISGSSLS